MEFAEVRLWISGAATERERFSAWFGAAPVRSPTARTDAYRWSGTAARRDALAERCTQSGLDFALLPESARLSQFRLLALDMDSTLITIECLDEIADFAGLKSEVAAITEATMRGEITDFKDSLARRVALLRGLDAGLLERVYDERLRLSPGAEALLDGARQCGLKTLLVSGGFTFFTERLKERLGFDFACANTLEVIDGRITGRMLGEVIDAAGKAAAVSSVSARLGSSAETAIAIGDGANDLGMMALAGLSVAYHARTIVAAAADCSISFAGLDLLLDWLDSSD